jgi:Ca2+-binding RTX toxin-like protein
MANAIAHDNTTAPDVLRPIVGDSFWSAGPLVYNFAQTANAAELAALNDNAVDGFPQTSDLPALWQAEIMAATDIFEEYINLEINFSNDPTADILVGQTTSADALGVAHLPVNQDGLGFVPIMVFNTTSDEHVANAETGGGNDRFQTIIHEIGHSLGLGHPHDTSGSSTLAPGAVPSGEGAVAPYQWHHTMMSYTAAPGAPGFGATGAFEFGRSVTPMALDIAALHRLYGANMTTRTTDTTYSLTDAQSTDIDVDSSDGTISVGRAYYGIWDAGTTDSDIINYDGSARTVINLMAATLTSTPDATVTNMVAEIQTTAAFNALSTAAQTEITDNNATAAGFFSSILDADGTRIPGGFSIANGVTIENATSGSGDDLLVGNSANNILRGNAGSDALLGGLGSDRLIGGAGNDSLYGGDGADTLNGGDGDDFIFGGSTTADLRDLVFAGAGNDSVDGGYGNDEISGQDGNDTIAGGFGSDTLNGQNGNDVLTGSALSDLVSGNAGDDFVNGGFGHDRINGGTGADRFFHLGILDHGSDFIQDYNSAEGDILLSGIAGATRNQFQINTNDAVAPGGERAGDDNVQETFVIYRPTGQILWALIDGAGQAEINIRIGMDTFDLLA